ncbi:flagellar hook-length control protein [Mycobacterium sp.]|uniref:flagellar hook-length control protein n=1 Tax=Mycobacterium sp. TaxID=1785 RepID=UPI003F99942E
MAALTTAEDIEAGRISPADLDQAAADECRKLFGTVAGPDDPLWSLHVDIARQVLAKGGIPVGELTEWVAVARSRTGGGESGPPATPAEREAPPKGNDPAEPLSLPNGPHSPDSGDPDDD